MVKPTTCIQSSSASPTCIQSSSSQTETEYVSEINSNSNTSSGSGSSKYKGVRKRKWGKWVSEIRLPNSRERIWLGSYDSAEKAARAFDAALYCLRGRDAKFNFPENPPEIAGGSSLSPSEIQEAAARFAKEVETTAGTITSNKNNVGLDHETTSSSSASLSVESHHHRDEEMMDWSFLSTLDFTDNQLEISDYGFYSGLGHFPGDQLYPPADFFAPPPLYDDQNGDDVFSQSSFLWNF